MSQINGTKLFWSRMMNIPWPKECLSAVMKFMIPRTLASVRRVSSSRWTIQASSSKMLLSSSKQYCKARAWLQNIVNDWGFLSFSKRNSHLVLKKNAQSLRFQERTESWAAYDFNTKDPPFSAQVLMVFFAAFNFWGLLVQTPCILYFVFRILQIETVQHLVKRPRLGFIRWVNHSLYDTLVSA